MKTRQINLLIELQQKKEEKVRIDYAQAEQHLQNLKQQLTGLSDFRLDYVRQLQSRGGDGITSTYYGQFQAFIAKLEAAITQQEGAITTAKRVVEQRKALWLEERKKLKVYQKLAEKSVLKIQKAQQIQEQKQLDEFTGLAFARRSSKMA